MKKFKNKKYIIIILIILALFFVPIPQTSYDDGGTREYIALTYKIVVWNKIGGYEDGTETDYHNTIVYWFPYNLKSINELWDLKH